MGSEGILPSACIFLMSEHLDVLICITTYFLDFDWTRSTLMGITYKKRVNVFFYTGISLSFVVYFNYNTCTTTHYDEKK